MCYKMSSLVRSSAVWNASTSKAFCKPGFAEVSGQPAPASDSPSQPCAEIGERLLPSRNPPPAEGTAKGSGMGSGLQKHRKCLSFQREGSLEEAVLKGDRGRQRMAGDEEEQGNIWGTRRTQCG